MFKIGLITGVDKRFQTCYIVKLDSWFIDERVFSEDFFATAMLLKNGGKIVRYGLTGMGTTDNGKNIGVNQGGLQLFDRKQCGLSDIEVFKEKNIYKGHKTKATPPYIEPII